MELHKQGFAQILRVTDFEASWKRELGEWLLAVAAITIGVWVFYAVGQAIVAAAIGIIWPSH